MEDSIKEKLLEYVSDRVDKCSVLDACIEVEDRRCSFAYADYALFAKVSELIGEFCEENGIDSDMFDAEDILWEI